MGRQGGHKVGGDAGLRGGRGREKGEEVMERERRRREREEGERERGEEEERGEKKREGGMEGEKKTPH